MSKKRIFAKEKPFFMTIHPICCPFSCSAIKADRLYLSAFPKIERHTLRELHAAARKGRAEYLAFYEGRKFVGLTYLIVRENVALLLYFAVNPKLRNNGYGASILKSLRERYEGNDLVILIESIYDACDNKEMRVRRMNFYLRNGLRDTGLIHSTIDGAANYILLNTENHFCLESYKALFQDYPFPTYLSKICSAPNE